MIFFGANDGMVHAVDARTGYEVWAFIPFNLLPKLRTLLDGQSVERFDYFVDSSPKLAEVKIGGAWKTIMVIGQSYGGTFYQAFDITEAGMNVAPDADGRLSRTTRPGWLRRDAAPTLHHAAGYWASPGNWAMHPRLAGADRTFRPNRLDL